MPDGYLHLWECTHILRLPGGNPDFKRCGHISTSRGVCPYDHGEPVPLVPLTVTVACSDCHVPIPVDACWTPDGRRVCGYCPMNYVDWTAADAR
ncbi:MAG: hypothetical protein Q8O56_06300 [Solirubrobacteraceae bacterium]|nr:hypothetical protein [Solirubrobacteraceae bacterium]